MNIKKIFTIVILLLAFGLNAQIDLPVLLLAGEGGIKYGADAQTKPQKLKNNSVLSSNGQLKLNGKGKAVLYCNGSYQTLEGKGVYLLKETFQKAAQTTDEALSKMFNAYLTAAGGKGDFGIKRPKDQALIKALSPVGGKLATFSIRFYWQTEEETPGLKLELLDENGKSIHKTKASGGEAVVDPRKARLFPGRTFSWRVFSETNPETSSEAKTFQMSTIGQKDLVLKDLKEAKRYQDAKPNLQTLMEAAYWEEKEWYWDADALYRKLTKEAPDNQLYQQLYKAFLQRCGLE